MKNTPFLQQVARYYHGVKGLEDYCFVFPNRRGGQFFSHYLQRELVAADMRAGSMRPHLMPNVTSINELVTQLTGTVAASDIEMMFALYDAYCRAMGDSAQEFDKFIYWAQLIISDFNDIDRSMADAAAIYQNLEDLHDLNSNYLSPEVKEKVKMIFGDDLFTAFFDTDADAALWRHIENKIDGGDSDDNEEGDDGVVKQKFMNLWNSLSTIYCYYHEELKKKGVVSPGMQLRKAAEQPLDALRYSRMVFVGFGVLSVAECKLFDTFKANDKADFWWDNAGLEAQLEKAQHDPGALLIDGYCRRFGAMRIDPIDTTGQTLRVVAVPSTVGQAKQAFNEVALIKNREREVSGKTSLGIETAIVLPDEGLLVPLLHSIHAPYHDGDLNLNVTLGYPLRSSGIVSLMHIVARLHHQASKEGKVWTYYREDVNDILSHPLIKTYFTDEALQLATTLARTNRFRVPAPEFESYGFSDLFTPAMDSDGQGDVRAQGTDYLDHLLSFCNRLMTLMEPVDTDDFEDPDVGVNNVETDDMEVPLQQAFLLMYIDVLNQLKRSFAECGKPLTQQLQRSTIFFLIDRLTATAIVPFTGEPLRGLQIMGLLETRSLDFENVVILSMNERVFPRRRSINSFIPNYMRRAYGMSTIEQQEAIVSYNFFRLLNRSSQVTLIYDSSAQKMGSSEPSRYITQLEKVYGRQLQYVDMSLHVETSPAISIQVPADGRGTLRTRYTSALDGGGKCLSASAINKFINCPMMFYMHYVQGLNEDSDTGDFMDYGTFGSIIHDTLSDCYGGDTQRLVNNEYIQQFMTSKLEAAVIRNIKKIYLHVPEEELDRDTRPLRGEAFMLIDTISSYVQFVLNHDLDLISREGPFTVLECERQHRLTPLEMGGVKFNFTYTPDRVDRLQNGIVRIVDYKTGSDVTNFVAATGLPDLFDATKDKRRKAILQLFLYCYAYMIEHPNEPKVMPVIYKLSSMKESGVMCKSSGRGSGSQFVFEMDNEIVKDFVNQMASTITSLYEETFDQAVEGSKSCNYCRFIDFCRRPVTKAW